MYRKFLELIIICQFTKKVVDIWNLFRNLYRDYAITKIREIELIPWVASF